ncbi:hypothetical protein [Oscillibacter sp.]|jgi:triacylglycerol lipase|uniref:esterase/lipase family protein n=1 Tax=Oscillibacter sp. TaxID=1945593 RepID=UPI002170C2C2|nr:hypothetical protein [Oscillibacter sp.]MCI9241598.1 hypothetical protein [Oscillibacter sp.]
MTDCRTRYPLLLIHGLNCRDDWIFPYWGRVADILREHGATVYLSGQDAWGSVPGNARALLRRAEDILTETESQKLNLIAHSKGGLEARYLISTLDFAGKTASLTTICTPHHGSRAAAEWLARERVCRIAGRGLEGFWRARGDRDPDFPAAVSALTPEAMARFNEENPDSPLVYYQSWGARLDGAGWDPMDRLQLRLTRADAPTDGLVSPDSAAWGRWRGTLAGVSHQDAAGGRRRKRPGFDAGEFYIRLIQELAEMGF